MNRSDPLPYVAFPNVSPREFCPRAFNGAEARAFAALCQSLAGRIRVQTLDPAMRSDAVVDGGYGYGDNGRGVIITYIESSDGWFVAEGWAKAGQIPAGWSAPENVYAMRGGYDSSYPFTSPAERDLMASIAVHSARPSA